MRDFITMCFDICTITIRVSIRVRGLHLVFLNPSGARKSEESEVQLQMALDGRHAPSCALQLRAVMISKSRQNTAREVPHVVCHLSARASGFGFRVSFQEMFCRIWVTCFSEGDGSRCGQKSCL